jgi:hypothetical protein
VGKQFTAEGWNAAIKPCYEKTDRCIPPVELERPHLPLQLGLRRYDRGANARCYGGYQMPLNRLAQLQFSAAGAALRPLSQQS